MVLFDPLAVPFDRVPVRCYNSRGTPYTKWVATGMPKLGEYKWLLDFAFFLYENEADAKAGVNAGGTGFFVGVLSDRWPNQIAHVHGVTNWHVAVGGAPPTYGVIRINRKDGGADAFAYGPDQWIFKPGGPDVAISPPLPINPTEHRLKGIRTNMFVNPKLQKEQEIDAAEDVFMVGKFVDYEGTEAIVPAFRFGHISLMDVKIQQQTGYNGRSIVVDMHSRTGFSGSPVFVYRTVGSMFWPNDPEGQPPSGFLTGGHMLLLLGLHWGQFPEEWEIKGDKARPSNLRRAGMVPDNQYIEGLSGMTCVIPAADILEVLDMPELKRMREDIEIEIERSVGKQLRNAPKPESRAASPLGDPPADDAEPNHRERFTALLNAAAKTPPQAD